MRGNKLWKYLDIIAGTLIVLFLKIVLRRKSAAPPEHLQKILVIKLAALGDTILLIPSLRALREKHPSSTIWMIGTSINEELISMFPQYVNRFISFKIGETLRNPFYFFQFIRKLRKQQFDVVIDFEQWSFITAIISSLAGTCCTIGFKIPGKWRHILYHQALMRQPEKHEAESMACLLSPLGIESVSTQLELPVHDATVEIVKRILLQTGWTERQQLVVVHPGCGAHGFPREWPLESYRSLCSRLQREFHPFFVFTGSASEERLTTSLVQSFSQQSMVWNEPGLEKLIALLSLAHLVVSGNNGVMHLAAALHKPQIALHGPTNPRKWGPLNSRAMIIQSSCPECPCLDLGFEYHRIDGFCMEQISVEEVFQAAKNNLE
ncbi:MAG TPA: glycosyltransferase family 9 protein [Bacteroidota bacterium]|nr:glycosyltransferase family 9 protein [Bacteroidota bacterium]